MFCSTGRSPRFYLISFDNAISDLITGISQRDFNYYDFLNEPATRDQIVAAVENFWQTNIKGAWESSADCESFVVSYHSV